MSCTWRFDTLVQVIRNNVRFNDRKLALYNLNELFELVCTTLPTEEQLQTSLTLVEAIEAM